MAKTITLKRRIGSIKNTKQITKAMELVSASKMRRAQERALTSRPYQTLAYEILAELSSLSEVEIHPLFEKRKVKSKLYILITSNSTLAGAYNYNVIKLLTNSVVSDKNSNIKSSIIAIGNQGAQHVRRLSGTELLAVYPAFGDRPSENDIRPVLNTIIEQYRDKKVDSVEIVYTLYKSNLVQTASELSVLPAKISDDESAIHQNFTNFEPSVEVVLDNVASRLIEAQIYQSLLESLASEHSMRMLAMKNATDNASDIIDDLTLEFNTARQASITQELAEITGGAEALKD
jgi:F-type H+-transporting ATPase subunit gamma